MGALAALATSSRAQDFVPNLPAGQVAAFGEDAYQIREPPMKDVLGFAKQKAAEYCKKMNKRMVVKTGTFSLGSGLYLVFTCVPSGESAIDH